MISAAGLALLPVLAGTPAAPAGTELRLALAGRVGGGAEVALPAKAPREEARAPACSGEICQPVVAVPGFEPRYSIRGKRTELVLKTLEKVPAGPLTDLMYLFSASGLRLDYTPPQLSPGSYPPGYSGWGRASVWLRWRIDAAGTPVFPRRSR